MSYCVHCFVVFCSGLLLYCAVVGVVVLLFHHCLLCCGCHCGIVASSLFHCGIVVLL